MDSWEVETASPEQTERLGEALGRLLEAGGVLLLAGDLGSGKTCLTRGVARGLGVAEEEPVTSPSYTLMNQYRGRCDLFHFDLYRLERPEDLEDLGFEESLAADGVVVVEWSQRFESLPTGGLQVEMHWCGERRRLIRFVAQQEADVLLLRNLREAWSQS